MNRASGLLFWLAIPVMVFGWASQAAGVEQSKSAGWPSLFRGVVVAQAEVGVRVISVDSDSQAYRADLRPEDIIVQVREADVSSVDDFAMASTTLKGRADHAKLVVFRNGAPQEIQLHLYSYPVLEAWGVEFIPDFALRFGDPMAGKAYWSRQGRGHLEVGDRESALAAHLNALHNLPNDTEAALNACELLFQLGQAHLSQQAMPAALSRLADALSISERLFAFPLSDDELLRVKSQLQATLSELRRLRMPPGFPEKHLTTRRLSSIVKPW
jgi:hypothetical protein